MERPSVWQNEYGVAYLCIEDNVKIGTTTFKKFIVNMGQDVRVVLLEDGGIAARGIRKLDKINLLPVLNRLLHPLSSCVKLDPAVQGILSQILEKEAEMAKQEAKKEAPKKEKFAPAGNAAPKAAKAEKSESPDHKKPMTDEELKGTQLYQTLVVTTGKGAEANEGSFFKMVHTHAEKPIKLADLIDNLIADEKLVLKSAKERKQVIRVRTRDSYTRLGYLQEAVGAKK